MLVQSKPVASQEFAITGISPGKFKFNDHFQMGGEGTTNLSCRCPEFYDSFQKNSCHTCEMPSAAKFIDVPHSHDGTMQVFLKEAHALKEYWGLRVPIKLVAHLRDIQKHGQKGHLATCGTPNMFLCRAADSKLQLVKMHYIPLVEKKPSSNSWSICSSIFDPDQVLEGPVRIFLACR